MGTEKEVDYIEHKFNIHLPKNHEREDTHLVKERIVYTDGTSKPNLKIITNFKRPFFVTKEHYRNHKDKKEYEHINKLNKYLSTESDLPNNAAKKIGMTGYKRNNYRDVLKSPYLYGSDIPSSAILSMAYEAKYGNRFSAFTVATLDIETDIDTKDIYIQSSAFKDTVRVTILRKFLKNYSMTSDEKIIEMINTMFKENIREKYKDFKLIISIHDTEIDCIAALFKTIHSWKPDFLAIWNVMFDITRINNAIIKNRRDPREFFCDPDLEPHLKEFYIKEGPNKKKKADGTVMQIDVQDRWHVIKSSSSFYIIDAMCGYSQVRAGATKVNGGYSLDNIIKENVKDKNAGKLKFDGKIPDNLSKEDWHRYMVKNLPLEYIVYNIGDNTEMLGLEDATHDLSINIPTLAGHSSFNYFNSGPSKIVDKLYSEVLEDNLVLGTKPYMNDENKILGLSKWIITLKAEQIVDNGLQVIKGLK